LATRLKFVLRIDESLDVFALHGVGGGVGCALTALFGSASIVSPQVQRANVTSSRDPPLTLAIVDLDL
jgi:Amt family ammonium transporter